MASLRTHVFTLGLAVLVSGSFGSTARAQDIFGLFRLFQPPPPIQYRYVPAIEAPVVRRPRPVAVEQPPIVMPLQAKPIGEVVNPVPELLADSTLRPGDMVMFPDGLRVFKGKPGIHHAMQDFTPLTRTGNSVASATRKLLTAYAPGQNAAWSVETGRGAGKLAVNSVDVEKTGSTRRQPPSR